MKPTKEQLAKLGKLVSGFIDRRTPEQLADIVVTEWERIKGSAYEK